jgi:hypothetical protein
MLLCLFTLLLCLPYYSVEIYFSRMWGKRLGVVIALPDFTAFGV